jgi:hypothetical protein
MSVHIPAYCPICRALYPSGIVLGEGSQITASNNLSNCPRGHTTRVLEGTFQVRDGVLHIQGQNAERIRKLALKAVKGQADADEALKTIEAIAPSLGPIIKLFGKNNTLLAVALILWFTVEITKALHPSGGHSRPIHIENRPTIINKITIDEGMSAHAELTPTNRSVTHNKNENSKRKKRRLRGKQRSGH